MPATEIDLVSLFNTVSKELKGNQELLNEADSYNHNHGDNMVNNFKVITKALKQKKDATPSEQLEYASQVLHKRSPSGSAQLYAQGLAQAAETVRGQPNVTPENAFSLVQALMGGGQPSPATQAGSKAPPGDMMGQLLGSLLGGGMAPSFETPVESQPAGDMGDLLGSLLGGGMGTATGPAETQPPGDLGGLLGSLLGGGLPTQTASSQPAQAQPDDLLGGLLGNLLSGEAGMSGQPSVPGAQPGGGLNLGTLLTMGMAYLQAKQQGASPIEAILKVIMSGSQMNDTPYHSQSGQLVASTLLNTIGSMLAGK